MSEDVIYTVKEVAKLIKSNPDFVYELINHGLLPALKLGNLKVRRVALLKFLEIYEGHDLSELDNIKKMDNLQNQSANSLLP